METSNTSLMDVFFPVESHHLDIPEDIVELATLICYVILPPVISVFGILANIVNICVYNRHSLSDSVNISFVTLATTDIAGLVCCLWYGIVSSPWFVVIRDLPFDPIDVAFLTAAWPRLLFSKITCWITAFITLERCACIVAPLHVKSMITPRKTLISMMVIYMAAVLTNCPLLYLKALFLTWKTDAAHNRTFLGMGVSSEYSTINVISSSINTVTFFVTFAIIILSTIVLIVGLHRKSKWRRNACSVTTSVLRGISKRDTTLCKTIVMLSVALVVSYTPYTINCILAIVLDGFMLYGKYNSFFWLMWSFSWLFETVNSSTSIFIYYSMSTYYRETIRKIFPCFTFKMVDKITLIFSKYEDSKHRNN